MKRMIREICLYLINLLWGLGLYYLARINLHSNSIKPFSDYSGYHIVICHGLEETTK